MMDWVALRLSLSLAGWTVFILLPLAIIAARFLAFNRPRGKHVIEALIALPLVLPPTVFGYYLLVAFGPHHWLGNGYQALFGRNFAFSFEGLLAASLLMNIPFAVQPLQRAFEAIPTNVREAAWCSGLSRWRTFRQIEMPLAWPGLAGAAALTFSHTLGEFGVVLMVGGNIPGETKTIAISIYDRVQAFDDAAAGKMAALLLLISFLTVAVVFMLAEKRHGS